jgi:aldehyde dehydrogenase (NAD+)
VRNLHHHFIGGEWVPGDPSRAHVVVNPATEEACAEVRLGTERDVNAAVSAAAAARDSFAATTKEERIELLQAILAEYAKRRDELAFVITEEMGCPISLSKMAQAASGMAHLQATITALQAFSFEQQLGRSRLVYEPIGVAALITPWNWPLNQIVAKVAAAIAAGCTMVLKPSEVAPGNAVIFAEIMQAAGVPAGVFNLVNGDGAVVGEALTRHLDVDMVSFTGSTRAGVLVAKSAAETVKRVHQELGGKSPNVILRDADLARAVPAGLRVLMMNSGQSCNAPSRMLVPAELHDEAVVIASAVANAIALGDPEQEGPHLGPLANLNQYSKVKALISQALAAGAHLAAGGAERPAALARGFYVKPTVFANVTNDMQIAREEIFGPVLCLIPYQDEAEAIRIANDTPYGLAAHVWASTHDAALPVARRLRAGSIHINGASVDFSMPFGGFKQSGNGREFGAHGIKEFLEAKAIMNPA